MLAQGSQLAQLRPGDTANATAYTAVIDTEVTKIVICNTTGSPVAARVFHDDDGTTFDQTTALYYDKSVPANDTIVLEAATLGAGVQVQIGGSIGVRSATGSALTFTIYGVTASIADRVRGL